MLLEFKIQSKKLFFPDRVEKLREIQTLLPSFQFLSRIKKRAFPLKAFMKQLLQAKIQAETIRLNTNKSFIIRDLGLCAI